MHISHFWQLMKDEFGDATARMIADSLVLPSLHTTAVQAIEAGIEPKIIWNDVCDLHDIPEHRRLGKDRPTRQTRAMDL